jgi:hypothetical protein
MIKFEKTGETDLNKLINLYSITFRENGHVNHLLSFLNDDNPNIRHMG